jgi:phage terminase large subunit-like protein
MTSKTDRADGLASAMQNRLVSIVAQEPNPAEHRTGTRAFLAECEGFPLGDHDDQVDAAAHGFNWLRKRGSARAGSSAGRGAALHPLRR